MKYNISVSPHTQTFLYSLIINGCQMECASKIVRNLGIEPTYEITIAKEGVEKAPTLDFDEEDVERIANKIVRDVLKS